MGKGKWANSAGSNVRPSDLYPSKRSSDMQIEIKFLFAHVASFLILFSFIIWYCNVSNVCHAICFHFSFDFFSPWVSTFISICGLFYHQLVLDDMNKGFLKLFSIIFELHGHIRWQLVWILPSSSSPLSHLFFMEQLITCWMVKI